MISGKEDLLQSLIEVFLMEKGTHEFYAQAVVKTLRSEAKDTFRDLADWEKEHMEYIQYLYTGLQDDADMKSFENFKIKTDAPVTEAGIPVKDLERKLEEHNFVDEEGALKIALEIEGKAYNLYRRLSEKALDHNARVIFKEMMEQERKHIDYLKEMKIKLSEVR